MKNNEMDLVYNIVNMFFESFQKHQQVNKRQFLNINHDSHLQ